MANQLAEASSPYLRQHAENPVDWFQWGEQAFDKAKAEDKPIFLSVGYSSCHWCHVMAHESFEDEATAATLNEHFVPIKVDREERPDIDSVYMGAVQAMTGRGGWPMSVFLTPEGQPFYGGTYWPRDDRLGMPGFPRVLEAVSDAWTTQRDQVEESGAKLTEHLRSLHSLGADGSPVDATVADEAADQCVQAWDRDQGGFGSAPKFPMAMTIDFLLAHHQRIAGAARPEPEHSEPLAAATHTLEAMARGGIYDHVGGGFARYSTDEVWLVPHFEKMLYDNALLLRAYTHAFQITGAPRFRRVAVETADYLVGEMQHPLGGFYSATDADSEGVEGKFFTWSKAEFDEVVAAAGADPEEFAAFFGVTAGGNFEGANILHEPTARDEDDADFAARLDRVRTALYARRETRVHPELDDKVLTSWSALALAALAEAGAVLGFQPYVEAARRSANFIADELVVDGSLRHTWREGHGASVPAFLEDVGYLAQALLVLYEADPDPRWVQWATELADDAEARFADGETGTYYTTAEDAEAPLTRPKELFDNAQPAGVSTLADACLRLAGLTGELAYRERAQRMFAAFAPRLTRAPTGYGEMLRALERFVGDPRELAIVGAPTAPETKALAGVYRETWHPATVLAVGEPDGAQGAEGAGHPVPLLVGRTLVEGQPAAYVCRGFACDRPVTSPEELRPALDG